MTYSLFLDDLREPPSVDAHGNPWVVVRSFDEAVQHIQKYGWPNMISFDHDLGVGSDGYAAKTGKDFANWLVQQDFVSGEMPKDFTYRVHSANPIGAANIRGLLDQYLKQKEMKLADNS